MFTAGICTTVTRTSECSCRSSQRSDSVNPLTACLAPQYADWSGMARSLSAEPTWTMVPALRGRIRLSATIVPLT